MKNLLTTLLAMFLIANTFAQTPEKMKYQAVIRDSNGHVVTNQAIGMQISIIQGDLPGTVVYTETQSLLSNANGLTSTEIGTGTIVLGDFSTIDWANGPFFLQIETDPTGGTNYTVTGTNQLLSVPYAMHSKTADSLTDIDSFSWSTTGNSGTDPANNFIGTTDDQPLIFKINNIQAGEISTGTNSYYGLESGISNTIGVANTGTGFQTLYNNTTGNHNTANGKESLYENTSGQRNTAIGSAALTKNETGNDNTAIGFLALHYNTTGDENTATGRGALYSNTTGDFNTANGKSALYYNTTGYNNTAIGYKALLTNTSGNTNTAIGLEALYLNTTGFSNTAIGTRTLYRNSDRSNNVAIGDSALFNNSIGAWLEYHSVRNTAIGSKSMFSNTEGYSNTANGYLALYANTTGFSNMASGAWALKSNTTGVYNTASGALALELNINGSRNNAVGCQSMKNNTSGNGNTAIGDGALNHNITGDYNTAVGYWSGPNSTDIVNSTAIGRGATTLANNTIKVGNSSVNSIGGYAGWSNFSDKRFKKEIQQDIVGLHFIMALEPVTYQLDMDKLEQSIGNNRNPSDSSYKETEEEREFNLQSKIEKGSIRQSGFLAQDVEEAAASVGYDFSGVDKPKNENDFYGLRYAEFVVPLVKGMQEQQELIEELTNENKQIKDELAQIKLLLNKIAQK